MAVSSSDSSSRDYRRLVRAYVVPVLPRCFLVRCLPNLEKKEVSGDTPAPPARDFVPCTPNYSCNTHVSLLPPPWDELTTREPRLSAMRVSPPGTMVTRSPCKMKGRRSIWRGSI